MKVKIWLLSIGYWLLSSCAPSTEKTPTITENPDPPIRTGLYTNSFGLVIHGGAGSVTKKNLSDSLEALYIAKLTEAITAGHRILEQGGSSLEAVTTCIAILEDSPLFNAGKGAVFTHEGTNELDASVMEGKGLNAGAVAGVRRIKNPINLAAEVMNNSKHVLLTGAGAEVFAQERGIELIDPSYFFTQDRYNYLQNLLKEDADKSTSKATPAPIYQDPFIKDTKYGTVGCVALDKDGNLAAGTSTGGMTNKRWNRIGDSPIIGAGTYANNATCGVSCTGAGEYFMRSLVAYDVSAMLEYKGSSLSDAVTEVVHQKLVALEGAGGLIALDKDGNVAMDFNTNGMYRAFMDDAGNLTIGIYKENFPTQLAQ